LDAFVVCPAFSGVDAMMHPDDLGIAIFAVAVIVLMVIGII
jgi:hypothetical protein